MKYIYIIISILLLSSCYTPKYALTDVLLNPEKVSVKKDKSFVLVKNNFPFHAGKFNEKVDNDFKSLFGNKLTLQQNFINFDTNVFKNRLSEEELILIKDQTNKNYLLLLKTLLKPDFTNTKKDNSLINKGIKRQYHVILEVYDLQNLNIIYAKESGSLLEFKFEGISSSLTAETQLEKTYELLFKDFKNFINKNG